MLDAVLKPIQSSLAPLAGNKHIVIRGSAPHVEARAGGYLLLGHSESLINVSSAFELEHLHNDLVYRRPIVGETARDPWHVAAMAAIRTTKLE